MKQLIKIQAKFLKEGDLIFDFEKRDLQKVEYVLKEDKDGHSVRETLRSVENIHVDYGEKAMSADNFKPTDEITILIDTDKLEITTPENIGYK